MSDEERNSPEQDFNPRDLPIKRFGVTVHKIYQLPGLNEHVKLCISSGSVVEFTGDCIVNSSNPGGLDGGGVDGVINRMGGEALVKERQALPFVDEENNIRIRTGGAAVTTGGNLPVKKVVHAVGPMFAGLKGAKQNKELMSAYKSSLKVADDEKMTSIGFCLISSNNFRGPRDLHKILEISVLGIVEHSILSTMKSITEIHLIAFKPENKPSKELKPLMDAADKVLAKAEEIKRVVEDELQRKKEKEEREKSHEQERQQAKDNVQKRYAKEL